MSPVYHAHLTDGGLVNTYDDIGRGLLTDDSKPFS